MKKLVNISLAAFTILALASCEKTDLGSVKPSPDAAAAQAYRSHHTDETDEISGGDLFTDKDKCKKCHTTGREMIIDWSDPFMTGNRYSGVEDLIENFDFVNYVHLPKGSQKVNNTISSAEKTELISYLKNLQPSK